MNQAAQTNITIAEPETGSTDIEKAEGAPRAFRDIPCLDGEYVGYILWQRKQFGNSFAVARDALDDAETRAEGLPIRFPSIEVDRKCSLLHSGKKLFASVIDAGLWGHLMKHSGMKVFLGKAASDHWDETLDRLEAQELTPDNIEAVFRELYENRDGLFEHGVIEFFRFKSWNGRTDQPQQLGKRLTLFGVFSEYGSVDYRQSAWLDELMRIFYVLDGKLEGIPDCGIQVALRDAKAAGVDLRNEYVRVRSFQNGNVHVFFLRPDLVGKMNSIAVKHYPNALPPAK